MCMTFFRGQIRSGWNQFKYKYRDTQPFIPLYPDLKKEFVVPKVTLKQQGNINLHQDPLHPSPDLESNPESPSMAFIPRLIWVTVIQLESNPHPVP